MVQQCQIIPPTLATPTKFRVAVVDSPSPNQISPPSGVDSCSASYSLSSGGGSSLDRRFNVLSHHHYRIQGPPGVILENGGNSQHTAANINNYNNSRPSSAATTVTYSTDRYSVRPSSSPQPIRFEPRGVIDTQALNTATFLTSTPIPIPSFQPPIPSMNYDQDNPFRPEGQLSHEVQPIVEMYKRWPYPGGPGSRPISPSDVPDSGYSKSSPSGGVADIRGQQHPLTSKTLLMDETFYRMEGLDESLLPRGHMTYYDSSNRLQQISDGSKLSDGPLRPVLIISSENDTRIPLQISTNNPDNKVNNNNSNNIDNFGSRKNFSGSKDVDLKKRLLNPDKFEASVLHGEPSTVKRAKKPKCGCTVC